MNYLTCGANGTVEEAMNTIQFWSENTYQHIDTLIAQNKGEVFFDKSIVEQLSKISKDFKGYYKLAKSRNQMMQINKLMKEFIGSNNEALIIFQRLKFEGLNGIPLMYQEIYHFIYEQLYINCLFKNYVAMRPITDSSVVVNSMFNEMLYYKNKMSCKYSTVYFWSLIACQHASIIENAIPNETMLPDSTKSMFKMFIKSFNRINFELSELHSDISKSKLDVVADKFEKLNEEFLEFMKALKVENPMVFPNLDMVKLPAVFEGVLNHIIDEHEYVIVIMKGKL